MKEQTDSTFIRNVSIVIVILVLVTFSIVFVARDVGFKEEGESNPTSIAAAKERIKPIADVYTDEAAAAAAASDAPAAQPQAAPEQVVLEQVAEVDDGIDAEKINANVCAMCHATGLALAPVTGSAEMSQRAEKGLDALVQTALNGLNAMPARGGRPDLSDEEIKAAVEFMLQ